MNEKIYQTKVVTIWQRNDGIIQEDFVDGAIIGLLELKEIIEIGKKLFNPKYLVYVDMSNIKSVSYEARNYLKTDEASLKVKAIAYKIQSKVSTIIGNFLNYVNKPDYPTKLFTNEEKAIEWLKSFEL